MAKKKILTREEIIHLTKLANLELSEKEIEKYQKQLSSIVDYISQLNQVNTKDVQPISQITGLMDVTTEDNTSTERSLDQKEVLKNAKKTQNGFFQVKAILNK